MKISRRRTSTSWILRFTNNFPLPSSTHSISRHSASETEFLQHRSKSASPRADTNIRNPNCNLLHAILFHNRRHLLPYTPTAAWVDGPSSLQLDHLLPKMAIQLRIHVRRHQLNHIYVTACSLCPQHLRRNYESRLLWRCTQGTKA